MSASFDAECKSSKYFENNKIISYFCLKHIVLKTFITQNNAKKFGLYGQISFPQHKASHILGDMHEHNAIRPRIDTFRVPYVLAIIYFL